jgi:hypothetical protein
LISKFVPVYVLSGDLIVGRRPETNLSMDRWYQKYSGLRPKYRTRLKKLVRGKHLSLFVQSVSDEEKKV